jgi:membrane protease YdiL (CAAX protease family)
MSQRSPETLPYGLGAAILTVLAFVLIEMLIGGVLADLQDTLAVSDAQLGELARVLATGLVVSTLLHWRGLGHGRLLHDSPMPVLLTLLATAAPLLALLPLLWAVNGWVDTLLQMVFPLSAWEAAWFERAADGSPVSLLSACLLAPVLEEMLFRGLILRGLLTRYPPPTAIVHSAALFGLAHFNIYQFFVAFSTGIVLGLAWQRTRSLWPCVLLHAGFNAGVMWMSSPDGKAFGDALAQPLWLPVGLALFAWGARLLLKLPVIPAQGSND